MVLEVPTKSIVKPVALVHLEMKLNRHALPNVTALLFVYVSRTVLDDAQKLMKCLDVLQVSCASLTEKFCRKSGEKTVKTPSLVSVGRYTRYYNTHNHNV